MARERKTDIGLKPEESQVVARDFNLFYKPTEMTVDPAVDTFVKSLDSFVKGAGTKGVLLAEKKEKELNEAEAKKLWEQGKKDLKSAVESGQIDENANPYLIDKYKELNLNGKAREFKNELFRKYEELGLSEDNTATGFDDFYKKSLEDFMKKNELLNYDAIDLNKGFFSKTDKIYNSLSNTHNQTQLGKIGERYKEGLKNKVTEIKEVTGGNIKSYRSSMNSIKKYRKQLDVAVAKKGIKGDQEFGLANVPIDALFAEWDIDKDSDFYRDASGEPISFDDYKEEKMAEYEDMTVQQVLDMWTKEEENLKYLMDEELYKYYKWVGEEYIEKGATERAFKRELEKTKNK